MQKKKKLYCRWEFVLTCLFVLAGCMLYSSESVSAAGKAVTIRSCELDNKCHKIIVEAEVNNLKIEIGQTLYLLGLDSWQSVTGPTSMNPLAVASAEKGSVKFSVYYKSTMLYKQFVIAYQVNDGFKICSNASYITNPEALAVYTGTGAETYSKKGIQADYGEVDDPIALEAQHIVMNWTINEMFRTIHTSRTIWYRYRGKTYFFDSDVMDYHDNLVKQYVASGARVYVILLLRYGVSEDTKSMCYTDSDAKFSSINITNGEGCLAWEALMSYLGERYSSEEKLISGWILGNEVDSPGDWNYAEGKSLGAYMTDYAAAYRICYNAVKSKSKNTNVYISLDYNWNQDMDGRRTAYFTTRAVLDAFYSKLKSKGKIGFRIAYHAYSQGLIEPAFWDDFDTSHNISSKIVTMNNIEVLTDYVREHFGSDCTIMLAEQSFNSRYGERLQAATYAYAYYICESNDMIESFAYGREFDTEEENNEGIYWGLSDRNRNPRLIWNIFKYIDCRDSFQYTNSLLSNTNLSAWTEIGGSLEQKIATFPDLANSFAQVEMTDFSYDTATSVRLNWKPVARCDGYQIYRDGMIIASIKSSEGPTYVDTNLQSKKAYVYKVRAYKKISNYDFSDESKLTFGKFSENKLWFVP